ncbi:MAG: 30S ribosomal protein S7 [Candidatus Makana argininalis]
MSRRNITNKRKILPDTKFGSEIISKFINILMIKGKKTISEKIVYKALDYLSKKSGINNIESFKLALENVRPIVEVKSRRVGGSTYQVPIEVRPIRSNTLAMRWIIESARKRKEKTMSLRLYKELLDATKKQGLAFKKREDIHKMAEANKAFAHYRW